MKLRIGTRGSDLALWQARHIAALLAPERPCELVVLKTRGDLIDDVPLQSVEGKAFFTGEIERALLDGEVDLAVHSHKDLPTEMTPGLSIAAVPERASMRERLLIRPECWNEPGAFLPLARGAKVGTSSPRRAEQLALLRPDLAIADLRGNVPTRVKRLREGRYDAIVLAAAGLDRLDLDLSGLKDVELPLEWFVPAPAQGALAIQIREQDQELRALLERRLHRPECARAVAAERGLLARAGGGCNLPLGASVLGVGPYRAVVFLGADHPAPGARARWAAAEAGTPEAAADLAFAALLGGGTRHGPLAGLRVALCGSARATAELAARLSDLGADVGREELITFEQIPAPKLQEQAAGLVPGDALAVTSREAARRLGGLKLAPGVELAAVGQATAAELRAVGLEPTWIGEQGAAQLGRLLNCRPGATVLFPCAEETVGDLERELSARGVSVVNLPLYRTTTRPGATRMARPDVRIFLSPSSVRATRQFARDSDAARVITLGLRTQEACLSAGWTAECAADSHVESALALLAPRASAAPPPSDRTPSDRTPPDRTPPDRPPSGATPRLRAPTPPRS